MERNKWCIQSRDIRNASIIPKWHDIRNADINELDEMLTMGGKNVGFPNLD